MIWCSSIHLRCLSLQLLDPHPTVVANKLLARNKFIDNGKQFNMIACSWIQFMIHDWIDHMEDTQQVHTVKIIAPTFFVLTRIKKIYKDPRLDSPHRTSTRKTDV
jgi:hypothetical protein